MGEEEASGEALARHDGAGTDPTIVFDLGGVLIDWNPRYLYRKLLPDEEAVEDFLNRICPMDWNERQDAGRPFAEAVAERIALFPEHEALIRAYQERWLETLGGALDETVEIFDELRARSPVYALTNWSAETWPHAVARFEFLSWFEGILVSGEERLAKPDPRIYHRLLEKFSLDRSRLLFIDDNARNVAAAEKEGIASIHFVSAGELREELVRRGVLRR